MTSGLRPLPLVAAAALIAGCAAQGPFPSLAPRAVQRAFADGSQPAPPCLPGGGAVTPAPAPPPPPAASDPVLLARIAQLKALAQEGDSAFQEAIAAAAPAVSGAGAAGSESWIEAQLAISRAETARAPTVTALADLTALTLEQAAEPAAPTDQQTIEAAVAEVQALANRQIGRLEELKAALSSL